MYGKPKESDWKTFSRMLPDLREKYLRPIGAALVGELTNPDKTPTEQFWDTFKIMKEQKKVLEDCLDDCSRSKMAFQPDSEPV